MKGRAGVVRSASLLAPAGAMLLLFAVTVVVARLCLDWLIAPGAGSPLWWPVTGVALVVVVRCPRRWWPALLLAFALANMVASRSLDSWSVTATYALVNILELGVASVLLAGRHDSGPLRLRSLADAGRFAMAFAAAISIGCALIVASTQVFPADAAVYDVIGGYAVTHALGLLSVAPLLLTGPLFTRGTIWQNAELAAVLAGGILICIWAFLQPNSTSRAFPVLLPVIWASVRLDVWRATAASLMMCAFAAYGTASERGTFAGIASVGQRVWIVQLLIATISITTLVLILITRHRTQLAAQARDSEQTMRIAIRDALVGMYSIRLEPGHVGEISDVNSALCAMLRYRPDELLGRHCSVFGASRDPAEEAALEVRLHQLADGLLDAHRRETRFYTATGEPLWVEVSTTVVHTSTAPPFALIHVHDLTDREENKKLLEQMALHDALTGVPNRTLLFQRLETLVRQPPAERGIVGLLYLDLDGFKAVNDTYGHAAGDAVLVAVADRLRATVRPTDTVARLGGDEFAVVCASLKSATDLDPLVSRVRAALRETIALGNGESVQVDTSIGVAVADGIEDADRLVRRGDAAMYVAKRAARARRTSV